MNKKLHSLALMASIALATACGEQPTAPAATSAPPAASATAEASAPAASEIPAPAPVVAEPTLGPDSPIWFEPQALSECGKGEIVTVHWNAGGFPGVRTVEVSVSGKDGAEMLFAATGVENQKQTGPWALAGTEFILRDQATKKELQRARIPSAPCATP